MPSIAENVLNQCLLSIINSAVTTLKNPAAPLEPDHQLE